VQQEKQKLNNDIGKLKKKYEDYQTTFEQMSSKYENAIKEKMLMKLEKDRLIAKVENLEANLRQLHDNDEGATAGGVSQIDIQSSPGKTQLSSVSKKGGASPSGPGKYSSQGGIPQGVGFKTS